MECPTSLSHETIKYVKSLRRNGVKDSISTAKLKSELSRIISDAIVQTHLNFKPIAVRLEDNDVVSLTMEACCPENQNLKLTIHIDTQDQSFIKASAAKITTLPKAIVEFQKSPAFKRYFELDNQNGPSIIGIIPSRQLTSRYLSEYLTHLIKHIKPFFNAFNKSCCLNQAA